MQRINKIVESDNDMTKKEKGQYQVFYNTDEIKSYDDIKNYFKNFKLEEAYENELKEYGYESVSDFRFYLHAEDTIFLLLINLDISLESGLIYKTLYPSTDVQNEIRETVNQSIGKYPIILHYDTVVYKTLRLEYEEEYEFDEEDEEEDDDDYRVSPIIETGFASDNCVVCCVGKPNILNFPCLHISHCESCEEKGRFINCSICRKEIQRKVKI